MNTENSTENADAKRLEWVSRAWGGQRADYASHVLQRGGTGDLGDIRSFIDAQPVELVEKSPRVVNPMTEWPWESGTAKLSTKLDMTLTKDEAEHIAAFVTDDNEATDDVLRLLVGDGHSGYGLYAAHPEFPDEGAVFVKGLASPSAQPSGAPEVQPTEKAPPHSLPSWSECALRVGNSKFIAKRVAEGGYGAEDDTMLATELHRFIHEYDDADPLRSGWFMHRLELLVNEIRATAPAQTGEPTHAQLAAGAFIPQVSGFATRQTGGVDQAWMERAVQAMEGLLEWDYRRNYIVPYKVRDPIIAAINSMPPSTALGAAKKE